MTISVCFTNAILTKKILHYDEDLSLKNCHVLTFRELGKCYTKLRKRRRTNSLIFIYNGLPRFIFPDLCISKRESIGLDTLCDCKAGILCTAGILICG